MATLGVAYSHPELACMHALFQGRIDKLDKHERCQCDCFGDDAEATVTIGPLDPRMHTIEFQGDPNACAFKTLGTPAEIAYTRGERLAMVGLVLLGAVTVWRCLG